MVSIALHTSVSKHPYTQLEEKMAVNNYDSSISQDPADMLRFIISDSSSIGMLESSQFLDLGFIRSHEWPSWSTSQVES